MKSQTQTDSEILASAKQADEINLESSSTIRVRHTRSTHPVSCRCSLHRITRFENFSSVRENQVKSSLDWYRD